MCVEKIPTTVCLHFIQLTNECQVQNRPAPVPCLSRPESIGDPINNKGFEFSTNFLHLFRQSALLKSNFVKSRVLRPASHRLSFSRIVHTSTRPISVSVELELELHCCCYCFPRHEAPLDAPCASLTQRVVRHSRQSFRSLVPNLVLQVTIRVAVALTVTLAVAVAVAVAVTHHCHCYPPSW